MLGDFVTSFVGREDSVRRGLLPDAPLLLLLLPLLLRIVRNFGIVGG
eukprot:COSAG06_NODE_8858_length_2050_cov_1.599692_1_plen_47_part_00